MNTTKVITFLPNLAGISRDKSCLQQIAKTCARDES